MKNVQLAIFLSLSCPTYAAMPVRSSRNLTDKVLHVNHAEQVSVNRWCILITYRGESTAKRSKIGLTHPLTLVISQTGLSDKKTALVMFGVQQNSEQTNPYRKKNTAINGRKISVNCFSHVPVSDRPNKACHAG